MIDYTICIAIAILYAVRSRWDHGFEDPRRGPWDNMSRAAKNAKPFWDKNPVLHDIFSWVLARWPALVFETMTSCLYLPLQMRILSNFSYLWRWKGSGSEQLTSPFKIILSLEQTYHYLPTLFSANVTSFLGTVSFLSPVLPIFTEPWLKHCPTFSIDTLKSQFSAGFIFFTNILMQG